MTLADVFAAVEAENRARIEAETWGHLSPKGGITYHGWFLFTRTAWDQYVPIDHGFETVPDSPWFFATLLDFAVDHAPIPGAVYRFDGVYRDHHLYGDVVLINTDAKEIPT